MAICSVPHNAAIVRDVGEHLNCRSGELPTMVPAHPSWNGLPPGPDSSQPWAETLNCLQHDYSAGRSLPWAASVQRAVQCHLCGDRKCIGVSTTVSRLSQ